MLGRETKLLFLCKNKVVGILDCNAIKYKKSSNPDFDLMYAPKNNNGGYVRIEIDDELINGMFYRNGELLKELKC